MRAQPALLTGTSSEFLGRRALPHILRDRPLVVVLGPRGSGKTCTATRLAGDDAIVLNSTQTIDAICDRIRNCRWPEYMITAPALVLDGPSWLHNRPATVAALTELFHLRVAGGGRTLVCQDDCDASIGLVMAHIPAGSLVVLGLRFPKGKRGRLRFARRVCDELGLPRIAARGTDQLAPWGYERVIRELAGWSGT